MDFILTIIRILTAIIAPAAALIFTALALIQLRLAAGNEPEEGQSCLRCDESRVGGEGQFHYAEAVGNARERAASKSLTPQDTPILGSESHFVCDKCARRFIRNEIIQIILLVLPYPLYLYVIIPVFAQDGVFANFLIETLLVVLSVAGVTAAFDLYRAVRNGASPLAEARDRVAITERKNMLGKKFSYYSRMGAKQLNRQ
jgi:hypothetical protein